MSVQNPYYRFISFVSLVLKMRTAQKNYFKARTQSALIASKQLEKEVDEWIYTFGLHGDPPRLQATQPELKP